MQTRTHPETDRIFRRLRMLLRRLGRHGGSITPSIYETAQVLRFCPQFVNADEVIGWLLHRQQRDGGWEQAEAPLYRTVPTLAAVLALHEQGRSAAARRAKEDGLRYLARQHQAIDASSGQYLPVAMELILPRLLNEAEAAGLGLARERFHHIDELHQQRLALIARFGAQPNSPPMFSWEAWGVEAAPALVGVMGGVGHSPAATAWWLHQDTGHIANTEARERAYAYLVDASLAAGAGIRGVVPGPWPMNRFEQSFVLHMVVMAGLAGRHELASAFVPQAADLQHLVQRQGGVGFSDAFAADGDDTAAAVGVLAAAGLEVCGEVLAPFRRTDHFVGYPFEMHIAHTVTARAAQALSSLGQDVSPWCASVVGGQQADGWWSSEKWHRSRLYGTAVALAALPRGPSPTKTAAARGFLQHQRHDGGWGCFGRSTAVETAFGILALCNIARDSGLERECLEAIVYAHGHLRQYDSEHAGRHEVGAQRMWISKDLYCARRIDQAVILCALAAPYLQGQGAESAAPAWEQPAMTGEMMVQS
jgi:hypothetical protein